MATTTERPTDNRAAVLALLDALDREQAAARAGGGARYVDRHRERGRLLCRERIELLVDEGSPFLELSTLAGHGTEYAVGAAVVTGIGVVSGVECVVIANDATVRGGGINPYTLRKILRALTIARENRIPVVNLVESAGGDLPRQAQTFIPGGALYRDLTQLSAAGIPTVALVFGNATAGGAYVPGMSDHVVMIDEQAHVFLGGPPLVKMATGEESDAETLGGALMHASRSGVADHLAADERDALRIGRRIVARLNHVKPGRALTPGADPPRHDPEGLLELASVDLRRGVAAREVIDHLVDGSRFDEFKARYGANLVTGYAEIHGYQVGLLANERGVLFSAEAHKASQFIQLANRAGVPLIFLQNTTGFMVGAAYEEGGIVKDGAKMINAVANSTVPHITVIIGSAYGAGNYAMCGRAFEPRFLFSWPNARSAIMGAPQLAGVLSLVKRESAARSGRPFDEQADAVEQAALEAQIESESTAFANSAQLYDDGVIDPRDTRTVLGLALSVCDNAPAAGAEAFGVFRM
jgi:acetyl-CoA carboxylase carboxyltransferase component